jgi:hypothetical protein
VTVSLVRSLALAIALAVVAVNAPAQMVGAPWTGQPPVARTAVDIAAEPVPLASARETMPRRALPNARARIPNPASPAFPSSKPNPNVALPGARDGPEAQYVGTVAQSFPGITFAQSGSFVPPDPHGDVGPAQVFASVNSRLRTLDKATGVPDGSLDVDANLFFAPVRGGSPISDQRVVYDRLARRWLIVTITTSYPNRILLAVSDGAIITSSTAWSLYQFQQDLVIPVGNDAGLLCDFPNAGVDASAVYVGCDMFDPVNYYGSTLFVVNKASIIAGGPIVVTVFRDLMGTVANPTGPGPNSPKGVIDFDPAATVGYFIGEDNQATGTLDLVRINDPGGTPVMMPFAPITTATFQLPLAVEHRGNDHPTGSTSGLLDGSDNRVMSATMRSGTLWLAHTTAVDATGNGGTATPDRNAIRWYQVGSPGSTPTILQSGTIYDPSPAQRSYFYGSVDVSGQGHASFGFSLAGPNDYAAVGVDGRLLEDPAGTTQGVRLATAGLAAYVNTFDHGQFLPGSVRRWGDFSNTLVDPDDDMTFWTIQEYTEADGTWATRVVRLLAPPPATPSSVTPPTIPAESSFVLVTVTGQIVSGSGFFDPGPGFAKRLAAIVPGVALNGVTYHGPTSVTLDVSTVGSPTGVRDVTIVNPDGQSATGIALLTIGAPGGQAATTTTLASALNPATTGQDVPLIASVAPVAPATGTPGGNVTFYDDLAPLATIPLVGGVATLTASNLMPGKHGFSAVYSGDASFYASSSSTVSQQMLAMAAVATVTNNADAGPGSLRDALFNADPGASVVFNLACPTTIVLASGALTIAKSLSIVGPGARCLTISGNNASRVFAISEAGADVGILGLKITQGRATGGGGIQNQGANLTLTNVAVVGNNAQGGAGGGIDHEVGGTLAITGSTIAGNQNTFRGGGVQVGAGAARIVDSTITSNTSVRGGGIRSGGGAAVALVQSTVSHNAATGAGSSGGNLSAQSGLISLANTIVAQGTGSNPDLDPAGGAYGSLDYNQVDSGTFAPSPHDRLGPTLPLGTLANNGGATDTRLPPPGSAVIDAIPATAGCNGAGVDVDQRAIPRPQGAGCDIGALETGLAPGATPSTLIIGQSSTESIGGETVHLSATVAGVSPSGRVIFFDGANVIGAANVSASFAGLDVNALGIGNHVITALYSGDAANAQSMSSRIIHGVLHAPATVSVAPSANPIAPGTSVTFTATLTTAPPSSVAPSGNVLFFDGGALLGLGTVAGGTATLTTTALVDPGTHTITAVYAGDRLYNGSSSPALAQSVNGGAATNTALVSSQNPSPLGSVVTFTATVSVPNGTPTGVVAFNDGANTLGTATLANGAAAFATSTLDVGPHSITAVFAGDGAFPGSVSPALVQTVTASGGTASRSFVASIGDDTNPCTLPSPCRSLAAAMSATNPGGEIIIMDSAGYDPVVITKPISVIAPPGVFAGIDAVAGTGIVVSPGAGVVRLSGLTLNGLGGATGIDFQSGEALYVEDMIVSGFTGAGLNANLAGPGELFVRGSTFRGNGTGAQLATNAGVVTPLVATIEHCRFENNTAGIALWGSSARAVILRSLVVGGTTGIAIQPTVGGAQSSAEVRGTTLTKLAGAGLLVGGSGAALATLTVTGSQISESGVGIDAQGGGTANVTGTTVVRNAIGVRPFGGSIISFGDNRLSANATDGTFTTTLPRQ